MRRWDNELKVGIFVVVGAILLGILLTMASDWALGVPGEKLTLRFDDLNNLKQGAQVQLAGVAVGKVVHIRLDESGYGEVTIRVEPPVKLREGLTAELKVQGFVGETSVMLTNGDPNAQELDWSKPVIGSAAPDLMAMTADLKLGIHRLIAFLDTTEGAVVEAQSEIKTTADAARALMSDTSGAADRVVDQAERVVAQMSETLATLERRLPALIEETERFVAETRENAASAAQDARALMANANETLDKTDTRLRDLTRESSDLLDDARAVLNDMNRHASELRGSVVDALDTTTDAVTSEQKRLNETLSRLDRSIAQSGQLVERIDGVVANIEQGGGTIGKLVTEDELIPAATDTFQRASDLMERMHALTESVEQLMDDEGAPLFQVGAETTYRSAVEGLQNEASLMVRPNATQRLFASVSARASEDLYSVVLEQKVGPIWGRLGFIDSEASLGLDWQAHPKVTLRAEAIDVTRELIDASDQFNPPRIDAELIVRPFRYARFIFGGENLAEEDRGFIFGVRTDY